MGRLAGCPVFDPAGDRLGKVRDVVVVYRSAGAPRVIGLVLEIPGRRHVFVSIGRVTSIAQGQIITTGLINVRRFQPRADERRIIAEILAGLIAVALVALLVDALLVIARRVLLPWERRARLGSERVGAAS